MTQPLTSSEWIIMKTLYTHQPTTSRQLIDALIHSTNWKEGTIKSFIARLVEKGYIQQNKEHSPFILSANQTQESLELSRLDEALEPICTKKRGEVLLSVIETTKLSKEDCCQLIDLLTKKIESAPNEVPCHCPNSQCQCHLHT